MIALSDRTGDPLGTLYQGLRAKQGVLSTRQEAPLPARQHLNEVALTMRHLGDQKLGKPLVHIIDAEADSVGRLRRWDAKKERFVVRGDEIRPVKWQGREWYFWRWKIETYFKLLKSAGHHVEQWRQTTAEAIARRLLVAATACLVVWRLARAEGPQAESWRELLVRLSGRLVKRDKKFTEPALLAGLWNLLAILDTLERYTAAQIKRMAAFILPTFESPESG